MKKYLFSLAFALFAAGAIAQSNDPAIMKINGKEIKKSEFEYIYNKNNNEDAIDKKTLSEYIELFRNFKLKVVEAEAQGLDTTASFRSELKEYRMQLAKPFLTNLGVDENLIRMEYNRMKENVEISHILISFSNDSSLQQNKCFPADTLAAYKKALQVRKRLQKGEKFEALAMEVSADQRSKEGDHPGYLGWFTALSLIPAMEDGAYDTPVGEVSMPIRTNFGYHLIKVLARQADPGQVHAAHILINCPVDADTVAVVEAEKKIDDIYTRAIRGEDFSALAKKYSDDKGSAVKGGDLSWFGFGMMVKEFQAAAFSLKEVGEMTQPIRTQFGFHIIKLLEKKPLESYEEKKGEIVSKLERNGNSIALHEPGMEKLKKENGFSQNENTFKMLQEKSNTMYPTDSLFLATFENNQDLLFITGDEPFTVAQFIRFLKENERSLYVLSTDVLKERLQVFEFQSLLNVEDKLLEKKYPEFHNLMQEYWDGILLFDVSNKEVWNKAAEDATGLKAFFEQNKEKYAWDKPHYKGYLIMCKDAKTKKKMQKETAKMDPESAVQFLLNSYTVGDVSYVKVEKGLFVQGDNAFIDEIVFKSGKAERPEAYQDFFVMGKLLPRIPDDYTDVRGLVITDYQDYLEKVWVESLNKKYPVIIYPEVVNSIK